VELDVPHALHHDTSCLLQRTTYLNTKPPIIARVCREARQVAFAEGGWWEDGLGRIIRNNNRIQWFIRAMDVVHLHWWPAYDGCLRGCSYGCFRGGHGNAIAWFLRLASEGRGATISADLIFPFEKDLTEVQPTDAEILDALDDRKDYLVCLKMICIHISLAQAHNPIYLEDLGIRALLL
jgi:hypothetical protein